MENDNKENVLVTDFDFTMIADFFKRLNRQGPGGDEETRRALALLPDLPACARVADIGCGSGAQTAVLATALPQAHITAVDLLPEMIEGVEARMKRLGLTRVEPLQASMFELPFEEESLDLLWCEGAIFIIGFEEGLRQWHRFLRPGACIGLSECCWLGDERPADTSWLTDNMPEIDTIAHKRQQMEEAGYEVLGHFVLPERCWTDNYYTPMPPQMEAFVADHGGSLGAREFVKRLQEEIEHYKRNGRYYGYVFFVGRKK